MCIFNIAPALREGGGGNINLCTMSLIGGGYNRPGEVKPFLGHSYQTATFKSADAWAVVAPPALCPEAPSHVSPVALPMLHPSPKVPAGRHLPSPSSPPSPSPEAPAAC
ncbi:pleckstrin homology domain-containing family D member 1 [Platysternon megacephalum]|uniref:Pleckstrin homology domain-containing family D member 1 n=1 Tax=Platysternon megacephalum TaxID=55544 RepID=A0A4D9EVF3_9SAUR|nr:pleckstrin homology domain-containing family D member 1 [Platysternon megacephalum]